MMNCQQNVNYSSRRQSIHANEEAESEGFTPGNIYLIKQGVLSAYYKDTEIYMLQDYDIFLPEFIPNEDIGDITSEFNYSIKFSLHVQVFTPDQLAKLLENRSDLIQLLIEINSLQQFLCLQTIAVLSPVEERSSPKFEAIKSGEIIIQEDDDALPSINWKDFENDIPREVAYKLKDYDLRKV